jgi:hypothetical protein
MFKLPGLMHHDQPTPRLEGQRVIYRFLDRIYTLRRGRRTLEEGVWQYEIHDEEGRPQGLVLDSDVGHDRPFVPLDVDAAKESTGAPA